MKRGGPIRRRRKAGAKIDRRVGPLRVAYVERVGRCALCGCTQQLAVHEIANGAGSREQAIQEPATWLVLCNDVPGRSGCHGLMSDKKRWPVPKQLCLKLITDPEYSNLAKFNAVYTHGTIHKSDLAVYLRIRGERLWVEGDVDGTE